LSIDRLPKPKPDRRLQDAAYFKILFVIAV